jgi:hypothetical protein
LCIVMEHSDYLLLSEKMNTKSLWDLAIIADGIKNILVGDGDGDGYQDIFVHTLSQPIEIL